MFRNGTIVWLAMLFLLHTNIVEAQSYEQLSKWCYEDFSDDQTIRGCDNVILAGRQSVDDLARAFYNRGLSYQNKRNYSPPAAV